MPMIDSHAHLDACAPGDRDLVGAAAAAGVTRILTVGTEGPSVAGALEIAARHESVFAAVGQHPHAASSFDSDAEGALIVAASNQRVRAIGETGLDYYREYSPRRDQMRVFRFHIEMAKELGLPLVIHTRSAEDDTYSVLERYAGGLTIVMHCFSAPERVEECVDRGYLCSFAGNVTYRGAEELMRAAMRVPDDLLLVETDAPFLSPTPVRGKPNEPANVCVTARAIAKARGTSYSELERVVERNARHAFRW